MDAKTINGITYSHAGQEDINFYEITPHDWCRKNTKVKFKRNGIVEILVKDVVLAVINPKMENICFDNCFTLAQTTYPQRILSYILTKLIKNIELSIYHV